MKKLIISILIAACSSGYALAQKPIVENATRQDWSGGVPGNYGTYYNITIKSVSHINIDSLYMIGRGFGLNDQTPEGNVTFDSVKHTYTVSINDSHSDGQNMDPVAALTTAKVISPPPHVRIFSGIALVTYTYKGKKQYIIVNKMTSLEAIAYP